MSVSAGRMKPTVKDRGHARLRFSPADKTRIRSLARLLGEATPVPMRAYLTGGASAVVEGWRESTSDVMLLLEPSVDPLARKLAAVEKRVGVKVKLHSPAESVPELRGWRPRSPLLCVEGLLELRHFDFYSQALSKIECHAQRDLDDLQTMIARGLVLPERLRELYLEIEPGLSRNRGIDRVVLRQKIDSALG